MAMDFFEHQELARRNTRRLVILFVLGVVAIILSVHLAVSVAIGWGAGEAGMSEGLGVGTLLFNPELFLGIAGGVVLLVAGGSTFRIRSLRGGGETVARTLGGRRLDPSTSDADERRALNVVEEMAIASGISVPPVFILEGEDGINAFAAGFEPGDAVVGLTRGAVTHLSREELQGVVAHEFSHILNGDMRLNIRLIGILYGILLIGIVGRVVLRSGGRRRGGKGNQAALLGLALLLIGYVGTFFGNLIKAAVSREREFLADASAVQFTRDPDGISGALAKLGGLAEGSRLQHPRAEELSHMYFGSGIANKLGSLFATHPPLRERIRRIDPEFQGRLVRSEEGRGLDAPDLLEREGAAGFAGAGAGAEPVGGAETLAGAVSLDRALAQVGRPTPEHLAWVRELLDGVPPPMRAAAHQVGGARALIHALLMNPDPDVRARQREVLEQRLPGTMVEWVEELAPLARELNPHARLPLVEMALGTLQGQDDEEHEDFLVTVEALADADGTTDLFEWMVAHLVLRHLASGAEEERERGGHTRLRGLERPVACVLSALAHAGNEDPDLAAGALQAGMELLPELPGSELLPLEACGPGALDDALDDLARLVPEEKRRFLEACATAIAADHRVTTREGEIFRVVADWLDCPVPPLLPGQTVA